MRVRPGVRRSSVREGTYGPEVVIPVRRNPFVLLFLPVWLTFWGFGWGTAVREIVSTDRGGGPDAFLVVWLLFWTVGGVFAAASWLWTAVGREVVGIHGGVLWIRLEMGGLGHTREYDLTQVHNLRATARPPWPFGEGGGLPLGPWRAGGLAFDYGSKTIRFGGGIEEAEAAMVVEDLTKGGSLGRDLCDRARA